jgi:sugar phosphate isomerase/epimerase
MNGRVLEIGLDKWEIKPVCWQGFALRWKLEVLDDGVKLTAVNKEIGVIMTGCSLKSTEPYQGWPYYGVITIFEKANWPEALRFIDELLSISKTYTGVQISTELNGTSYISHPEEVLEKIGLAVKKSL